VIIEFNIENIQNIVCDILPLCVLAVNPAAITQSPASFSDDDDRKLKRGVLPKRATQIMKSWLFQHIAVCFTHISQFIRNRHFSVTLPHKHRVNNHFPG